MIAFRPLALDDLPAFAEWLNRPHLREFYQRTPISPAEVADKYGPSIRGEKPTRCHLALLDGRPFGYLQCYRIAAYPEWAATISEDRGIGVDLFIAEPELIGRGFGKRMLGLYLKDVAFPLFPEEGICFIGHALANDAGRRNSESLGFRSAREFLEDGVPSRLYRLEAKEIQDFRG